MAIGAVQEVMFQCGFGLVLDDNVGIEIVDEFIVFNVDF